MPNKNLLKGMRCPVCGYEDAFSIFAEIEVYVTDHGTKNETAPKWSHESLCTCEHCGHSATVTNFQITEQPIGFVQAFVEAFPELDNDETPLSGGDCVDRVAALRKRALILLNKTADKAQGGAP